jgi:hypothetical protein
MIALLLTIVIIVLVCYLAVWVLGQLAPGHPAMVDTLIWVLCVVLVVLVLVQAFGLSDIRVPKLR